MSDNLKFNKHKSILSYLKQYGGKDGYLSNVFLLKDEILDNHTESELKTIRTLLITEIENKKHHGPMATGITIFSTAIVTFFIYYFVFSSNFMINMMNQFIDKHFEFNPMKDASDEEKKAALQSVIDANNELISPLLDMALQTFIIMVVPLLILFFSYSFSFYKNYRPLQFYKNLIDECISEKELQSKKESVEE